MTNLFLKIFLRILIFIPALSLAQSLKQDTTFLASSIYQTKKLYAQTMQGQAHLYNGTDYLEYIPVEDENPYFASDDWELSTVVYAGESFENVPILYDISSDKVITEHYYTSNKMQLINELIHSFTFRGSIFIRMNEAELKNASLRAGFYQLLYDGELKAYARRTKIIQKRIAADKYEVSFDEKNRYYIYKNGAYFEVNSKSSILQVLSDKKQELKRFTKDNDIRFRSNQEKAMIAMITYYDSITR